MQPVIHAIILGIIQGLTEFLPVSSSGHLEIAKYFFDDPVLARESLLMTVVLHFGTALSTVVIFWKDISRIFAALFTFKKSEEFYFSLKIVLSMIPAALVGLFFEEQIEMMFEKQLLLVGCALAVTGFLLFLADRAKNTVKPVGWRDALLIGLAQAIAITPGISRSGATISTSVLLGIDRERAARFSFLMVVPLIFGKIAKDLLDGKIAWSETAFQPLLFGFAAAFVTGLLACYWMIKLVKKSRLSYFGIYCLIVAALAISKAAGIF